ncbi:hypothetical protein N9X39_03680 [Alphaproteobacteria bacterium]|nr:hypothetical protein [Alphaproteobacteria bacterium]
MANNMIFVGISEEHDSGVAIVKDGRLIFAISEERSIRKKFPVGFPYHSFTAAVEFLRENNALDEPINVSVGGQIHVENIELRQEGNILYDLSHKLFSIFNQVGLGRHLLGSHLGISILSKLYRSVQLLRRRKIKHNIANSLPFAKNVEFFDHHFCHAASAYYSSGFKTCITFTLDAAGDGFCSKAYYCQSGQMTEIQSTPFFHSIGYYYYLITNILGFKVGQEGKVTGLAARGDPVKTAEILKKFIYYNEIKGRPENIRKEGFHNIAKLKTALSRFDRNDIAAGIQSLTEEIVARWLKDIIKNNTKGTKINVALAGGVFANVLLNQKIAELNNVKSIFVFPAMGDGGLCAGAAFAASASTGNDCRPRAVTDVYLGPNYSEQYIASFLQKTNMTVVEPKDIYRETARLLADGKIVGRFDSRMEFGPRALGNRSILCSANSQSINDVLNDKLKRSEFMPFAPAVMEEHANRFFDIRDKKQAATFMTVTCHVREQTKKLFPAIVHIDGTARPQLVLKSEKSGFYFILKNYYEMTGHPILVNTSFNIHEEPIVMSPEDALRTFLKAKLDALSIGRFLVLAPDD